MAFTSGASVLASDYNTLITDLNNVYSVGTEDSGYGATAVPSVGVPPPFILANKVQNENWLDLHAAITLMGNHQDDVPTLPDVNDLEDGDIIQAFATFTSGVAQVTTNKLVVGSSSTTVDSSISSISPDVRNANWSSQIKHVFTADFGSDDAARHFFNTGGQIRLTMDAPNTIAAHNWGDIYDTAGTFIFDHIDYYSLSSTINNSVDVSISTSGGGVYSVLSNAWTISARYIAGTSANGARGSKIEISSISTDTYSGNPSFPGSPDVVVGTFTSTIGERRSVTFFNRPSPTYATVVSLADGS